MPKYPNDDWGTGFPQIDAVMTDTLLGCARIAANAEDQNLPFAAQSAASKVQVLALSIARMSRLVQKLPYTTPDEDVQSVGYQLQEDIVEWALEEARTTAADQAAPF